MAAALVSRPVLARYALLTYAGLLVNFGLYWRSLHPAGAWAWLYLVAALLSTAATLLVPFVALMALARWAGRALDRRPRTRAWATAVAFVVLGAALQIFVHLDRFVFDLYGFHVNGFVWNIISTRGGISSMNAGSSTHGTFALIFLGYALLQAALLAAALRIPSPPRRAAWGIAAFFVAALFTDKLTYGCSRYAYYAPVLSQAHAYPLYIRVNLGHFPKWLGVKRGTRDPGLGADGAMAIRYPLAPVEFRAGAPRYNVVWLVAESWRWDLLDPEVMPATCRFADRAATFQQHYSSGNGTRMGMFGMFYGLYGAYWFPFLAEHRAPVLMERLAAEQYDVRCFTSAAFTYPEFDRTVFATVPADRLHEGTAADRCVRDRENVDAILRSLDGHDPSRPFFRFMFFETTHAPYDFPEECAIRKPYTGDVNYLTMDLRKDVGLMKNRYVNAAHYLDTQFARVLGYLEERGLLDSTIVVITGDHGEEFMEKGHWGHNNAFTEEQTRTPLVLWVPGRAPVVETRMTSHLDLPATVLGALGSSTPSDRYSLGQDLLGGGRREFAVFFEWEHIGYADAEYKMSTCVRSYDFSRRGVWTKDDAPVADTSAFYESRRGNLLAVMEGLRRFRR